MNTLYLKKRRRSCTWAKVGLVNDWGPILNLLLGKLFSFLDPDTRVACVLRNTEEENI